MSYGMDPRYYRGLKGRGRAVHYVRPFTIGRSSYTLCDGTGWARITRLTDPETPATCKRCLAIADSETEAANQSARAERATRKEN